MPVPSKLTPYQAMVGVRSGGAVTIRNEGDGIMIDMGNATPSGFQKIDSLTNSQVEWIRDEVYLLRDIAEAILEARRIQTL